MGKGRGSRSSRGGRRQRTRRKWVAIGLVVLAAAGAGVFVAMEGRVDSEAMLADATRQFEAGDLKSALINLKTVVSRERENRAARFLLGRTYLAAGDPVGALKEFKRARELGETSRTLNLGLTRATIATGNFDEAATEIAINGDTSEPDWLVLRGMLDLGQQRLEDARAAFTTVLAEDESNEQARRGLMQAELAAGNSDLARGEVETLLAARADDVGLWLIKGELDLHDGNGEQARDAFQKVLELAPENPLARIGAARAFLALDEIELASSQLDALPTEVADNPRVSFLRALIADGRGDRSSALHHLRKVLQVAPMHRETLITAAKLHFASAEYTRAQDYIARLLEIEPGNVSAQRMMGAIQLASGRLDGLSGIGDAAESDPDETQDPGMLALLGTAYLKHGRVADSRESLERAVALAPDSLPIRTQLALSKLSSGQQDEAIEELETILAEDPEFVQARIMLALAHASKQDLDKAREVAADLVRNHGKTALAHNVNGYVQELSGQGEAAAASYRDALARDPAFHPARINLARLALQAENREEAKKHLQDVLDIDAFQPFALMGLAALALQADDLDEAERLWILAREHNPDAVGPRLLLSKHYRAKGSLPLAEKAIREAYAIAPFAPQVQAEYTTVMLATGKFSEALEAATALTNRAPKSPRGLELLAQVYNQLGDAKGLEHTLERIAEIAPDAIGARLLLGRLAIRRKDYDAARAIEKALLGAEDTAPYGYELRGDIELALDAPELAAKAYLRSFETRPASSSLLKLDRIERDLGRGGKRLAEWLETHPDDLQVRLVHATYLQQEGDSGDAITEYETMADSQRDNPVVLNNLAWLYHEAGDERATEIAQRAYELAPKQAEIVDTYGWILFEGGQQEQGLDLLRKAHDLAPKNPDIVYHVAHALSETGQRDVAQQKLESILADETTFAMREQAESLLAKLSGDASAGEPRRRRAKETN